jgi:hypothetical protein
VASIPPAIDAVGTYGEDLYDVVKAGDWKKASLYLDSLRTAAAQLPSGLSAEWRATDRLPSSDAKHSLEALVDSLNAEIASKRRLEAQVDANRVTYISAELVRPYTSKTPVQVLLLDYEGRELEIWATAKNQTKLTTTKADIRKFWDEVRPQVESRNPTQAKHTEDLVAQIEKAKTPAELKKLATPFLDEVDLLEKVFTNQ